MRSLFRAMKFILPYKGRLVTVMAASLAHGGLWGAMIWLAGDAFEAALIKHERDKLWLLAGVFLAAAVAHAVFGYVGSYLSKFTANRVARDAQNKVMGHLLGLPISYFHTHRSGELLSRMSYDANALHKTVRLALDMVQGPLKLLAVAAVIFSKNWLLALLGFVGFPLAIGPLIILSRRMRKASRKSREKTADLSSIMVQIFGGIRLVRAYGQEGTEHGRFVDTNERAFAHQMRGARAKALGKSIVETLASLGLLAVLLVGGEMSLRGQFDAGDMISFMAALFAMYGPAKAITKANEEIQSTIPGAERIFELQDVRSDLSEAPDAVEVHGLEKTIEIRDLSFRYNQDVPVLRDINLRVEKGQTVALVGPTGAGKSTLLDLVCRFYDPQEGAVTIDGIDLRETKLKSLLAQIAIVPQEPFLFNDTVKANILYGKPDASQEDVEAAARAAAVHDEIVALSDGYDTVVGERGTMLSGGQRQRVSIARALLRNAPILVLDEATSSLDSESERLVQRAVERLLEGRTTLVIAHRLSTIRNADRIAVLVEGRIEETGTHAELLERSETYRRLWQMQGAGPAGPAETK